MREYLPENLEHLLGNILEITMLDDSNARAQLSRLLAYALRHKPAKLGLKLDRAGWADVEAILAGLAAAGQPLTRADLDLLVQTDSKQRYAFSGDGRKLRASQGHSIPVALGYAPRKPPERLYHGTTDRHLTAICKQGLLPGRRQHVHLSPDLDTARQVGARHGPPVIVIVDAGRMQRDGHRFCQSDNGVWLTEHVPPQYLRLMDGFTSEGGVKK